MSRLSVPLWATLSFVLLTPAGARGAPSTSTQPTAPRLLAEKRTDARLYVASVEFRNGVLHTVHLLWIPPDVEAACLKVSADQCEALDHNRRKKRRQNGAAADTQNPPTRVLRRQFSHSDTDAESRFVLDVINRSGLAEAIRARYMVRDINLEMPVLAKHYAVPARVRWRRRSNEETFDVLGLSARQPPAPIEERYQD